MGTSQQLTILVRLAKIVMPSVGGLMGGAGSFKNLLDSESSTADFSKAVTILAEKMDETETLKTMNELINGTYVQKGTGMPVDFEKDFSGRLGHLFELTAKVLEVNYGDFFGAMKGVFKSMKVPEKAGKSN
jgi:hypothetical protein